MAYLIVLYYTLICTFHAALLIVYLLEYRKRASTLLRRWFLLYLVNAIHSGAELLLEFLWRNGSNDMLTRAVSELRDTDILFNIYAIVFLIGSVLPKRFASPASIVALIATIASIVCKNIGLWRTGGVLIGVALLYAIAVIASVRFSHGFKERENSRQIGIVFVSTLVFLPGFAFNIIGGFDLLPVGSLSWAWIEVVPIYFIVTSSILLAKTNRGTAAFREEERPVGFSELSDREREVIDQLLKGHSNRAIAETLCISESTVKKHVNHSFRKLGVGSRWELVNRRRTEE